MQKYLSYFIVFILGLFIINFITNGFYETAENTQLNKFSYLPFIKISFWGFIFGLLIEWQRIMDVIRGNFKVNLLIIPSLFLLIISLIPGVLWGDMFSPNVRGVLGFIINPLQTHYVHITLSILSGILLVRSLKK